MKVATLELDFMTNLAGLKSDMDRAERSVGGATSSMSRNLAVANKNAGSTRAGFQQLGFQLNDVATSFQGGIKPMTIFAQQGSQVIQAIQLMSGNAKGFIGFLGGPWMGMIVAAATVLGSLASAHGKSADAEKNHEAAANSLADAVKDLDAATQADIQTERQRVLNSAAIVQSLINQTVQTKELTKAKLEAAMADLAKNRVQQQTPAGSLVGAANTLGRVDAGQAEVAALQAKIDAINKSLEKGASGLRAAAAFLIRDDIAKSFDKSSAAADRFKANLAQLTKQYRAHDITLAEYRVRVKDQQSALEAVKNADKVATVAARDHRKELSEQAQAHRDAASAAKEQEDRVYALAYAEGVRKQKVEDLIDSYNSWGSAPSILKGVDTAGVAEIFRDVQQAAEQNIAHNRTLFLDTAQDFADIVGGGLGRAVSALLPLLDRATEAFAGTSALAKLAAGAGIGGTAAAATGGNALTGAVGGALGGKLGSKFLTSGLESLLPGLGQFAGPLGSIAGGLLGGIVGGMFSKVKKASATVELIAGDAMTASIAGNSAKLKAVAGGMADSLIGSLAGIAEQLGGGLGDALKVSIGERKDTYRVDLAGLGRTKNMPSFGTQEEAVAYAVQSLIQQGAITGLRAGTDTLLKGAGDLQKQLQKAVTFEGVFTDLKQRLDPVGFAMDQIAKEFDNLDKVFKEAGASADDYAKLAQLRTLKEAEAQEQAAKTVTDTSERIDLERQLLELSGDTAAIRALDLAKINETNRALQQEVWTRQDAQAAAAAAAQAAAVVTNERTSLERALLQATGDTTAIRALDLAALDESNRAIQVHIWALQDQAEATTAAAQAASEAAARERSIADERAGLMQQLWQLTGDTASIRAAQLATTDDANKALLQQIWATQDAQAAQQAAQASYEAAAQAAADAAQKTDQLRQAWAAIGDTIMDEVKRIRGLTATTSGAGFAQLLGQFNAATDAARHGDQVAAGSLAGLSKDLLDAAAGSATSAQELARVQAQTAASLEATYNKIHAADLHAQARTGIRDADGSAASTAWWNTNAPVNDTKALKSEVAGLRADMRLVMSDIAGSSRKTARWTDDVTNGDAAINTTPVAT